MYILNIAKPMKKTTVKEFKNFILEVYDQRMGFSKGKSYYAMKHQKKNNQQFFATKLSEKNS